MIELYDIIEAIGKVTGRNLVLHRNMKVNQKFKVYKIFSYDLYEISNEKRFLLSVSKTINTPSDEIAKTWAECDKIYLNELFNYFLNNDVIQQISNPSN